MFFFHVYPFFSESNSEEETGEDNPVFDQLMEKVSAKKKRKRKAESEILR